VRRSRTDAPPPPPWREVFRGRRGRLTAGLLLLEALVAVQSLVLATILPDIRRDLGMVQLYGLVFSASSLATIASIPVTGRAVDALGARRVLLPVLALFCAGLLVAATAPAMPVLLAGQFLIGAGGGGLYALSLGAVAKAFPDRLRPRVMALLATMWILPGLAGPPFAALVATTVGWRWAFAAPLALVALGWILIAPALDLVPPPAQERRAELDLRWPVQLMVGTGMFLLALTVVEAWALGIAALGVLVAIPACRRTVPVGTFRAVRGRPAAGASAFLLSAGFLAMDAFLTLMLTDVRGLTLGQASLSVTAASITWASGSLWQSGRAERTSLPRLLRLGTLLVLGGEIAVTASLDPDVPLAVAFAGWAVVGLGMGVSFPTIPLSAMRVTDAGEESGQLSSVLLLDFLGVAIGAGLAGAAVAVSEAAGAPLADGIAGAFAIGLIALVALLWTGGRIPDRAPKPPSEPAATP
jgi:MFS family permease